MSFAQRMDTCPLLARSACPGPLFTLLVLLFVALVRSASGQDPQITVQPQNQYACVGNNATFYVEANGTQPLSFAWFVNGSPTNNGVVSTPTNSTLTLFNVQPSDDGSVVFALVSNHVGTTNSNPAQLGVSSPPFISQNPADTMAELGGPFSFNVVAGPSNLVYRWWFQGQPLTNSSRVIGADTPSMFIVGAQLSDAGYYHAVVSNSCVVLDSLAARCDVGNPPVITNQPLNQTAPLGSTVQISVGAGGTPPLFYQWFRDDVPIPGAINPILAMSGVRRANVGVYHVTVHNAMGATSSQRVQLQIELTLGNTIYPRQEATDFIDNLTNALRSFAPPPTVITHGVPLLFTTYGATAQAWETSRCGVPPSHSMWLLYYSPRAESTPVSTEGSDFNTVVAVYSWDGSLSNNPVEIGCDVNSGYAGKSTLSFPALERTDYYVCVDGVGGATGTARLQVGEVIQKPQLDSGNGSFYFELAGPYWYTLTLQSSPDLNPPVWSNLLTLPATNHDYVVGYTNATVRANSQDYFRTGVNTNSLPP
jgi:hypothetical protein